MNERVTHYYGDGCDHGDPMDEVGRRVLAVEKRTGPWREYLPDEGLVDRDGDYWTVIDRDTGEQVGGFGLPVQLATREAAIDEAWRFGSKWDWTVDAGY